MTGDDLSRLPRWQRDVLAGRARIEGWAAYRTSWADDAAYEAHRGARLPPLIEWAYAPSERLPWLSRGVPVSLRERKAVVDPPWVYRRPGPGEDVERDTLAPEPEPGQRCRVRYVPGVDPKPTWRGLRIAVDPAVPDDSVLLAHAGAIVIPDAMLRRYDPEPMARHHASVVEAVTARWREHDRSIAEALAAWFKRDPEGYRAWFAERAAERRAAAQDAEEAEPSAWEMIMRADGPGGGS